MTAEGRVRAITREGYAGVSGAAVADRLRDGGGEPSTTPIRARGPRSGRALAYLLGITRIVPIRMVAGSTFGFAFLRAARPTPNFWAIPHIVSPFLTL
jgi:hypothetical protein